MPVKAPGGREGARGLPAPDYLLWEITLRCNFRCLHCAADAGRSRQGELTTREALSLCDRIAEMGIPSVALMGGEPLLRKDWPEIARRLRSHGVEVGLITNGFLFDRRACDRVLELGICQVGVSLDAASPEVHDRIRRVPGAHARAVRAIEAVGDLGIAYPTVITSINKLNFDELDGILGSTTPRRTALGPASSRGSSTRSSSRPLPASSTRRGRPARAGSTSRARTGSDTIQGGTGSCTISSGPGASREPGRSESGATATLWGA
jgi:uncharacterized Fe-S cluster-containing radical SAM superfamily protein